MYNPVKLFIVEGDDDYRFAEEMTKCFFSGKRSTSKIIKLTTEKNIYMLYALFKKEMFAIDIVELLRAYITGAAEILDGISRDDVEEIYMFFDYDVHQNNIPKYLNQDANTILMEMLNIFNNETEHGKLYISYPMVEALYDCYDSMCQSYSKCFINREEISSYKRLAGTGNPKASRHMDFVQWKNALNVFSLRVKCLLDIEHLTYDSYTNYVTAINIFNKECELMSSDSPSVFVLSAFPEFLFDYFPEKFWNSNVTLTHYKYGNCPKLDN